VKIAVYISNMLYWAIRAIGLIS